MIDPFTLILDFSSNKIEKAQKKITLALKAKNDEIKASCQINPLTGYSELILAIVCFVENKVVVPQNDKNKKKDPTKDITEVCLVVIKKDFLISY